MANYSITVTNALFFEGPSNATVWNAFTWGQDNWGNVRDFGTQVGKGIDNTLTPDSAMIFSVEKQINEAISSDSAIENYVIITLTNTLAITVDMASETLRDGAGYLYVYPDDTTELEDRISTTWTESSDPSTTWGASSTVSTTWSAA